QLDAGLLHLGDQRRVVLLAGGDGFVHRLLHALGGQRLAGLVGEALPVGGLVVDDRDLLALELVGDVAGRNDALLVVAAADAEDVAVAALGEGRVGRGRRD